MALTLTRWIGAVASICTLVTAASVTREPATPRDSIAVADSLRGELQLRVGAATRRWEALARRDAVIARLGAPNRSGTVAPLVVIDPLLPAAHRSMIERAIQRQWTGLRIDSVRVPIVVVVVVDTTRSADGPTGGRGQIAFDYMPPPRGETQGNQRCVVIAAVQSHGIVNPASHRAFSDVIATPRSASALLGPCAFLARFGKPGPGIDQWLRSRSYDLAAYPQWWSLPATDGGAIGERWRLANAGAPSPMPAMSLSSEALGCTAGDAERCTDALAASATGDTTPADGLIIMRAGRDRHWNMMSGRYVSDLVTVLGPERFERFWRSDLDPSAALQAVAMTPLNVWTQQWASGLFGEQRVGPALSLFELAAGLTLAGLSLAIAAWGFGRRQVR
jgi:hypothetical protein